LWSGKKLRCDSRADFSTKIKNEQAIKAKPNHAMRSATFPETRSRRI
jgi:hypothetical protein